MCCEKHCAHDERTETPERRVLHDIGFFGHFIYTRRGGRGGKVQPIDGGTASGVYWTCVKMHEWPSAFAAADYNQNRDPEAKKYGMKRIWNNRSSARGWGKAAAVFTMAMVLAVGGLGAAMNLADLQGVVTVQPAAERDGTGAENKALREETDRVGGFFGRMRCGQHGRAPDGGRTHGTGTAGSRRAACRTDCGV